MRAERCAWLVALTVCAAPGCADPALRAFEAVLPAGAQETARAADPPRSHGIAIGPAGPMAPPPERMQDGTRLRIAWAWPSGDAPAVEGRLTDAFADEGFTPLYACRAEVCGGFDFRLALPVLPLPDMAVYLGDFRYMAAARADPPALAAWLLSAGPVTTHLQITLVAPAPALQVETDADADAPSPTAAATPEPPSSAALARRLDTDGRAVLEGLEFPPGGTALAQGDTGTLAALVTWLAADPARRVVLVGHTDWTGTPDGNLALSRARAAAVAAALEEMGATPAQVSVAGVGAFAPRVPNTDPAGRAANRRVEVVRLPDAQ